MRTLALPLAALLGATVAVVPSIGSPTASSNAKVAGLDDLMWSPAEVTVTAGGTVTFEDASKTIPHGVVWQAGPETPSCKGVPIDEGRSDWSGSCTFTRAGTYTYYCYVHGMHMSGTINVEGPGATTTETTTTSTTSTTTTTTTRTMPATTTYGDGSGDGAMTMAMPPSGSSGGQPAGQGVGAPPPARDSLTGTSVRLPAHQRASVGGSLEVAQTGSALRVALLLTGASAAGAGAPAHTPIMLGSLRRAALQSGRLSFVVPLDRLGRALLRRRGRLALVVRLVLIPPQGPSLRRAFEVELLR
jgi:plastocyanin